VKAEIHIVFLLLCLLAPTNVVAVYGAQSEPVDSLAVMDSDVSEPSQPPVVDSLSNSAANNDPNPTKIIPWRLALVSSGVSLTYIGAYWVIFRNGWWKDSGNTFHFANDFEYALNLDKGGHFFSGILMGEVFYDGLRWSGMEELPAHWWASSFAALSHVGIDIKDGYAPEWGFSVWDVIAGTAGGFWPMFKRYSRFGPYLDFKGSYWYNSTEYWRSTTHVSDIPVATDDYVNQTYWLSLKVQKLLPNSMQKYWPAFIAFTAGLSITEPVYNGERKYEVFIGPDWDLEGLFAPKSYEAKRIVRYLNYIHFPMPALQVYPHRAIHWVYPIRF
jgi:hypothetical protein